MKHVVFLVDETKSHAKWPLANQLKPNVTAPLVVPLHAGATVTLSVEESKNVAYGFGEYLWFTTDKLLPDATIHSTGNLQAFRVLMSGLNLQFNPKTGEIVYGTASLFVMGEPYLGGAGAWNVTSLTASSCFVDNNSPNFDFANGLGCGGGVRFELGTGNDPAGNFFVIHIEGKVSLEDVDGDGDFEVVCRTVARHKLWLEKKPPIPPDIPTIRRLPHRKRKIPHRAAKIRA